MKRPLLITFVVMAVFGGVIYAQSGPCTSASCAYVPLILSPDHPTPTIHISTPTPTSTPSPAHPGDVLYQADWSNGLNGWTGGGDWKTVAGMLVNDGTGYSSQILAPYQPGLSHVDNYAIEAEIQLVRYTDTTFSASADFNMLARADTQGQGGYHVGSCMARGLFSCGPAEVNVYISNSSATIAAAPFTLGTEWHTYYAEFQGNTIKMMVDGNVVLQTVDNSFLSGGRVGLSSNRNQISVRSFRVIML